MNIVLFSIHTLQGDAALNWFERALQQPAGSFAFISAIVIGLILCVHFVTKFTTHYNTNCERDRQDVRSVKDKIDTMMTDIAIIKGTLVLLGQKSGEQNPTQSHSPVSLTDFGIQLSQKMGLEARISNNWDKILLFLDTHLQSKNAYDIQQFCIETASVFPEKFFRSEDVEFLKNFAYREGKPLVYYGSMIGVIIRDAYFLRKGISLEDVDKHDPKESV
jgi:hypothetical protein